MRCYLIALATTMLLHWLSGGVRAEPDVDEIEFYERDVKPILVEHCLECHSGASPKAGLSLSSRDAVVKGGDSGTAAVAGKPAESLLIEAVNFESYEMPPKGKLPAAQIEILTKWVRIGLPWKPGEELSPAAEETAHREPQVNDQTRAFWSFQPIGRPTVPEVADASWPSSPIDAFVLARLESAGLKPAPQAQKAVLLRRAFYDLIGLPPSPSQVAAFLADESDEAFERVVEGLLDSPQYGEKWGRHWLDLVRYAETNSYERDGAKPEVWRYRDYVVHSFNEDKPYDQFVREQLAGDELDDVTPQSIVATGYYRLGIWDDEPADPELALYDDLDDILTTTSQVMLGLTINCARCHNHKIDPIPQRDYYRMLSFFRGLTRFGVRNAKSVAENSLRDIATPELREQQREEVAAHQQRTADVAAETSELEALVRGDFEPVEAEEFKYEMNRVAILGKRVGGLLSESQFQRYQQLVAEQRRLARDRPRALGEALCVTELGSQPRETFVLIRGNPGAHGDPVAPGFPEVLGFADPDISTAAEGAATSGRRRALADWIADAENPLTARVMANRVWQYHFGRGIVRTSNDFGLQGAAPTHPLLLDWLAAELIEGGWRLKRLHRQIMLSSTYRMAAVENEHALSEDPQNNLMWRFDMRRLTAEEIRDSILAVNGTLNPKMGGPSFYTQIPAEVLAGQSRPGEGWGKSPFEERCRRSLYIHVKRSLVTPIIASFDGPETDNTCPVRFTSTQPTQALGMLNSEFINEQARRYAEWLRRVAADDAGRQVSICLQRVMQREPTAEEIQRGLGFLKSVQQDSSVSKDRALALFCLLALNLSEFVYLE